MKVRGRLDEGSRKVRGRFQEGSRKLRVRISERRLEALVTRSAHATCREAHDVLGIVHQLEGRLVPRSRLALCCLWREREVTSHRPPGEREGRTGRGKGRARRRVEALLACNGARGSYGDGCCLRSKRGSGSAHEPSRPSMAAAASLDSSIAKPGPYLREGRGRSEKAVEGQRRRERRREKVREGQRRVKKPGPYCGGMSITWV